MNGAEVLVATALRHGIKVCFANPGTTEMPLVLALDSVPGLRGILCLHENVATGAADGYGRMTDKPAMCLLHLGPGLANGLTNLHNARRALTPVLNVIGQHTTWHLHADPLLATDVASIAGTVSDYVNEARAPATLAADLAEAIAATAQDGGRVATLVVPHDFQTAAVASAIPEPRAHPQRTYSRARVASCATALKAGKAALLLGGEALSEAGLMLAGRIAARVGADLICDTFFARMERGGLLPAIRRLPYFADQAVELTRQYKRVIVAGTRRPVAFFGYTGVPSFLTGDDQTITLADAREDAVGALAALATELGAAESIALSLGPAPAKPTGPLNARSVSEAIAHAQPASCIVMDEALTVGEPYFEASKHAPRFTHLMLTGGAIGEGPAAATGAAIACPDRKVINYQSDGCGAYTVQAFWTQAREKLNVVTVIGSNRAYNILNVELLRAGANRSGAVTRSMTSLENPHLDWVKIGEGFGVPAVAVDTAEALVAELEKALAKKGPRLIEAVMT
jgi:acetolactate synthase I/II/III large subunit